MQVTQNGNYYCNHSLIINQLTINKKAVFYPLRGVDTYGKYIVPLNPSFNCYLQGAAS